jgi:hypothetical protein
MASGIVAARYAGRRAAQRRAFLLQVGEGTVNGFRIDEGGALLVRVAPHEPTDYRAPRLAQPLVELDAAGGAKRTLV